MTPASEEPPSPTIGALALCPMVIAWALRVGRAGARMYLSCMEKLSHIALTVGRYFIAALFLFSGQDKVRNFGRNRDMLTAHGVPFETAALVAGTVTELLGGLLLGARLRLPAVSIVLSFYVVGASLMVPAKELADESKRVDAARMLASNVAVVGGLLYVLGVEIR